MLTSILSLVCLYKRHLYQIEWTNSFLSGEDNEDPNDIKFMYDEIINSATYDEFGHQKHLITRYFILEVIVLSTCPIPYYDKYIHLICNGGEKVTFLLSDFLLAFMFLRLYFLIRASFNFSIYTDALSKKVCKAYGFDAGFRFAVKCKLLVDPEKTVCIMFISTVCIFAYLVRIFEIPYLK